VVLVIFLKKVLNNSILYVIFAFKYGHMNIRKKISNLYKVAASKNKKAASSALFYIIQIKEDNREYVDQKQSLYLDIWNFVRLYIESVEENDYGYNTVNIDKIKRAIEANVNPDEKLQLYSRTIRKLGDEGFVQESKDLKISVKKVVISSLLYSTSLKNKLKSIIYCCCYNLWTVTCILLFLIINYIIITLPFSDVKDSVFVIQYSNYSEYFIINHILNIFGDVFEYNEIIFCRPNNVYGFILLLLYKFLFVTFFAGWFMKYFSEKTKISFGYEG